MVGLNRARDAQPWRFTMQRAEQRFSAILRMNLVNFAELSAQAQLWAFLELLSHENLC